MTTEDERAGPDSVWDEEKEPDKPHWLVDEMDDRLEVVGLPTYTALATVLRDVLKAGATQADIESAHQVVRDIVQRIELNPPQSPT